MPRRGWTGIWISRGAGLRVTVVALLAVVAPLAIGLGGPARASSTVAASFGAGGLEYDEIVTGDAPRDAALPLVVALHGRGGGIEQLRRALERLDTPVRLVVPRGPIEGAEGRPAWFRTPAGRGDAVAVDRAVRRARAELVALLEGIDRSRPSCGKAIVVGWSQGGVLAFVLALERPDLLERVVVVGGSVPEGWVPDRLAPHAPITALHGTRDARMPFRRMRATVERLTALGFDIDLQRFAGVAHELTDAMRREVRDRVDAEVTSLAAACRVDRTGR